VAERTRVGVIGCGLIAQVMHLPYLSELSDRFEVAAVCDLRGAVAAGCAERYGVQRVHARWEDLLAAPGLDAVLIATSGDHAPIAVAAARAGLHVFVEKPMALSSADAASMIESAEAASVTLMVGTMKRYDPAYERLAELAGEVSDLRLVRVTTLESPFMPYVAHYPLIGIDGGAPPPAPEISDSERGVLEVALGSVDEETRWCYRWIMLDNLVHELNMLGGLLGEPTEIRFAHLSPRCVSVDMRFGTADCHLSWVDLPGIARYRQELSLYAPEQRLTLELPSPFLRSMPTRLLVEGGESGGPHSWAREELVSFGEAFKRELVEFSDCIRKRRAPRTSGHDGLRDMRLAEAIAKTHAARIAALGAGRDGRDGRGFEGAGARQPAGATA
jgi:predicted dehydrogenase